MSEKDKEKSRRDFLKQSGAVLAASAALTGSSCNRKVVVGTGTTTTTTTSETYDVVIIGTGFGAAVAASQLTEAAPHLRILMLERGLFWFSPERPMPKFLASRSDVQYWPRPDNATGLLDFLPTVRTNLLKQPKQSKLRPHPLYRYSLFGDVDIVTASGVGGGSLIYSNVSVEPFFDTGLGKYPVMENWPLQLSKADYDRAVDWMEGRRGKRRKVVTTFPLSSELRDFIDDLSNVPPGPNRKGGNYDYLYLGRTRVLKTASQRLSDEWKSKIVKKWSPLELQVLEQGFEDPAKSGGLRFCERQGRCFLGCLPGARHTLNKMLIEQILTNPAYKVSLETLTEVSHVEKSPNGFDIVTRSVSTGVPKRIAARIVVVAAGVLGTVEILLRSKMAEVRGDKRLTFSNQLGAGFTTNGDFSGFVTKIPKTTVDPNDPSKMIDNRVFPTRGPINMSHIMFRDGAFHINVEDAGIPPMFAELTRATLDVMEKTSNAPQLGDFIGAMGRLWFKKRFPDFLNRATDPKQSQTEHEMLEDVFWFNCMGNDDSRGKFDLDKSGKLTLTFPGGSPVNHPLFAKVEEVMKAIAQAMGGTYVPFPLWGGLGQKKVVVTHPLGGCPIGRTSTDGAIDSQGQVFNTAAGAASTHRGLYVMDGSALPGPVAVNPTLTIVAIALRIADSVAEYTKAI